jgi:protein-S-isoprenylcysteine O-methyltransferase Ste14
MRLFLKNLLFVVAVPGSVAGWVPWYLVRRWGLSVPRNEWPQWVAAALLAQGAAVLLASLWEFAVRGRATPAPVDAPRALVVTGLYRYVRNPMYVGVTAAIAGWALLYESGGLALYGVCVFAAFNAFVILYEEPVLTSRFGDDYHRYRASVGRWLPRLGGPR